jgi:enoyl-CoA hydratase
MSTTPPLLSTVADGVATITLHRPEARNALNTELLAGLRRAMAEAEADKKVAAVILTGSDPAFCAGLDLKQLGSTGANLGAGGPGQADGAPVPSAPWAVLSKPLIAAVNGAAITGGLEIVLHCDLVVASSRARFGDTHARVGAHPGWGLTVLLPQAVGIRKAREMSFTGNFLDADGALRCGLANTVVPHHLLLPTARQLAADIVGNDRRGVQLMLEAYRAATAVAPGDGLLVEAQRAAGQHGAVTPDEVERRREAIVSRGRSQAG